MNASPRSEPRRGHPHLERAVITLLALGALAAIWLGIGLPGSPPLVGGRDAADGSSTVVTGLDTVGASPDAARLRPAQPRPSVRVRGAHHFSSQPSTEPAPVPQSPSAPTPTHAAARAPRRPDLAAPAPSSAAPPAAPSVSAPPPPAPAAAPAPPQSAVGDVQQAVDGATTALPSGSDVQKTVQNVAATVTNALPQLPVPTVTLPQLGG